MLKSYYVKTILLLLIIEAVVVFLREIFSENNCIAIRYCAYSSLIAPSMGVSSEVKVVYFVMNDTFYVRIFDFF